MLNAFPRLTRNFNQRCFTPCCVYRRHTPRDRDQLCWRSFWENLPNERNWAYVLVGQDLNFNQRNSGNRFLSKLLLRKRRNVWNKNNSCLMQNNSKPRQIVAFWVLSWRRLQRCHCCRKGGFSSWCSNMKYANVVMFRICTKRRAFKAFEETDKFLLLFKN